MKCEKMSEMCQMRVEAGGKWCRLAAVGERETGISRDPSDRIEGEAFDPSDRRRWSRD